MDDIAVRAATAEDAAAICTIYNQGIEDRIATLETELRTPDERRQWMAARGPRHPVIVAAQAASGVVGWASLNSFNARPAYNHVADLSIYIERGWRGKGAGRRLLDRVVDLAREIGYHKLVLAGVSVQWGGYGALRAPRFQHGRRVSRARAARRAVGRRHRHGEVAVIEGGHERGPPVPRGTLRAMADAPLLYYQPSAPVETEYRVGLCAWQDKTMLEDGHFYPIKSMKAEERLWWYSQFFDCVEVNSTFYAPLSAENTVRWVKRTPPGFLFSVKAYALLTGHHLDAARLPEPLAAMLPASARPNSRGQVENKLFPPEARDWAFAAFREALRPLDDSGKLGYVLFQMAPWVRYGREAMDYLASLPARLPGLTLAVEFRDASWLPAHTDEVLRFLADQGLAYVSVDSPRTPANVATTVALTAPSAVLRLHGRNAAGFLKQIRGESPSVAEKYGYLYDEAELGAIVGRGRRLAGHARRVYFKLNNNVGDAPAINGVQIRELLGMDNADPAEVEAEWRRRRRAR